MCIFSPKTMFTHYFNHNNKKLKSKMPVNDGMDKLLYVSYNIGGGGGLVSKSCLTLETPWTAACQTPLSMGFSRQEYWSELPFPSPGNLPYPGIKPRSPALQADSLPTELQWKLILIILGWPKS